jgi:uncharacterized protein YgiM (DUF1202 family)
MTSTPTKKVVVGGSTSSSGATTPGKNKGKEVSSSQEIRTVVKENLREVLGKLGNITDVIVKKNMELKGESESTSPIKETLEKASEMMKKLENEPPKKKVITSHNHLHNMKLE